MRRLTIIFSFVLFSILLFSNEQYPILFLHGQMWMGNYSDGWNLWGDESSSMMRIAYEEYKGYSLYPTFCNTGTTYLPALPATTIFNFSYYITENEPGVISISTDSVKIGFREFMVYLPTGVKAPMEVAFPNPIHSDSYYDYIKYYPRYLPAVQQVDYIDYLDNNAVKSGYVFYSTAETYCNNWKNNRYGENLSKFIDLVLEATGADNVNLVCHSMGGVVV